jgi:hypothetical protein
MQRRQGLVTTEKFFPSLQPKGGKPTAAMVQYNTAAGAKIFVAKNACAVVKCVACNKPSVVCVEKTLHSTLRPQLRRLLEGGGIEFSCGVALDIPADSVLAGKVSGHTRARSARGCRIGTDMHSRCSWLPDLHCRRRRCCCCLEGCWLRLAVSHTHPHAHARVHSQTRARKYARGFCCSLQSRFIGCGRGRPQLQ